MIAEENGQSTFPIKPTIRPLTDIELEDDFSLESFSNPFHLSPKMTLQHIDTETEDSSWPEQVPQSGPKRRLDDLFAPTNRHSMMARLQRLDRAQVEGYLDLLRRDISENHLRHNFASLIFATLFRDLFYQSQQKCKSSPNQTDGDYFSLKIHSNNHLFCLKHAILAFFYRCPNIQKKSLFFDYLTKMTLFQNQVLLELKSIIFNAILQQRLSSSVCILFVFQCEEKYHKFQQISVGDQTMFKRCITQRPASKRSQKMYAYSFKIKSKKMIFHSINKLDKYYKATFQQSNKQDKMESFFAKKGLKLSKNTFPHQQNKQQLLRSNQQPQISHFARSVVEKTLQNDGACVPQIIHLRPPHYNHTQAVRQEKSLSVGPQIRLMTHKELAEGTTIPKQTQWKYVPTFLSNQKTEAKNLSIQTSDKFHSASPPLPHNRSLAYSRNSAEAYQSEAQSLKLKNMLEAYKQNSESLEKDRNKFVVDSPSNRRESQELKRISFVQNSSSSQKRSADFRKSFNLQQSSPARKRQIKGGQQWFEQKYTLIKQINEKTLLIRQLQSKLSNAQRQTRSKVHNLEFEAKMLQQSRNRLQSEAQSTRKLLISQKEKSQKARQQVHKLIFFEDDLIKAKDYDKLKQELDAALLQNSMMFQQHQKYIVQVRQVRCKLEEKLLQVQNELNTLKKQQLNQTQIVERLTENGEDKMILIKLQNDLNFLKKKQQQSTQLIISKQKELQDAKVALNQMIHRQNQKNQSSQKMVQEASLRQINETIVSYETRFGDLGQLLDARNTQIQQQKKQIEKLNAQLRSYKQDAHLSNMKERSSQNNLRNEVQTLQRTIQSQVQLRNKRITGLQENLQRKIREISQKDKFIKSFLLSRAKQLQTSSSVEIIDQISRYFSHE